MKKIVLILTLCLCFFLLSCDNKTLVLIKIDYKPATCEEEGNEEYYINEETNEIYEDKDAQKKIEKIPVILALGHKLIKIDKVLPTCIEDGNEAYYECEICGALFKDAEGKIRIDSIPVIEKLGHNLVKIDKKEATCTENGNEEYYKCETCGALFKDADGISSIEDIPVINKTNHQYSSSYYYDEDNHWHECICEHNLEPIKEAHLFENNECKICHYKTNKPNVLSMDYITEKVKQKTSYVQPNFDDLQIIGIASDNNFEITQDGIYDLTNYEINNINVLANKVELILSDTKIESICSSTICENLLLNVKTKSYVNYINVNSNLSIIGTDLIVETFDKDYSIKAKNCYFNGTKLEISSNSKGVLADNIYCQNSTLIMYDKGDCIDASLLEEQGIIVLNNCILICETNGDAIKAINNVLIDNSYLNIHTSNVFVENNEANKQKYNLTSNDFVYSIKKSTYGYKPGVYNQYAILNSCKGISLKGNKDYFNKTDSEHNTNGIIVNNSSLLINSSDDCMFSQFGFIKISNSKLDLNCLTDSIRTDSIVDINYSSLSIESGYEGIEASQIQLFNSNINVHTTDDCIESSSRYNRVGNIITSGCNILVKSEGDDGFDAVNYLYIESGNIVAFGCPTEGEGIDVDTGAIIDRGEVLAVSHHTYTDYRDRSKQCVLYLNFESKIVIAPIVYSIYDSKDELVLQYNVETNFGNIVVSSELLKIGDTYRIVIGNDIEIEVTISSSITRIYR